MEVTLTEYPGDRDWMECKRRALVTIGKHPATPPSEEWKHAILKARHSPIRYLRFSFDLTVPYYVSVHLARHVHAQPYIRSQRNDRQGQYDRNAARQDTPVEMVWDLNGDELITVAEKRLCQLAAPETRQVVAQMCREVIKVCPEFTGLLAPPCIKYGICNEMKPCGRLEVMNHA